MMEGDTSRDMANNLILFQKLRTGIDVVDQVIEKLFTSLSTIFNKQIIDGKFLEDVLITTGATRSIAHGLQRPVVGYIVVKRSANSQIWDSESTNTKKDIFLNLNSSATVTISLWVF